MKNACTECSIGQKGQWH